MEVTIMGIEALSSPMKFQEQTTIKTPVAKQEYSKVSSAKESNGESIHKKIDTNPIVITEIDGKEQQNVKNEETASQHTTEQIKKAIDHISKNVDNAVVKFGIHEGTNRVTIKIVDNDTNEVIRELPPERILDMIAKAMELAGLMVDEKR